jgi:Mitochondrial carrier protein
MTGAKETGSSSTSLLSNALGSAAAGILSRICTHPLDTAKARLQSCPQQLSNNAIPKYAGPLDVLIRTTQTEGIRGLYRGFGAVIVGGTPGTVLYLCTYDIAKSQLSTWNNGDGNFVVHFCSGMIAETIACIVYVPVDVIKERMQVQHSSSQAESNYRNSWDALKQISKSEGLSGVYRGYGATLASFGPFSALYFVFYEKFKELTRQHMRDQGESAKQQDIPFQWTVLCSASAGALSSWLTSPLDMAKLRLQVQRGKLYAEKDAAVVAPSSSRGLIAYTGVVDCLRRSFRDGGVKGLFRGAGARVLHFAPATTVTMTTYETCRSFISKLL